MLNAPYNGTKRIFDPIKEWGCLLLKLSKKIILPGLNMQRKEIIYFLPSTCFTFNIKSRMN